MEKFFCPLYNGGKVSEGENTLAKHKTKKTDKVKISACYIVKDAAEDLRRSLESVKGYVDEIIVVDTGSADSTVEVAEAFGARILHEPWQDDFATPRNVALCEASGDWIVFLDADEYFIDDTAKNLKRIIKSAKAPGLLVKWVNIDKDEGNAVINTSYVLRIFKKAAGVHYVGKIHEDVCIGDEPLERVMAPANLLTLYHTGYSTSLNKAKAERNLKFLLAELAATDKPERIYSYLADAYYGLKDWSNVEKFARLDLEARINPSNRPMRLLIECLEREPERFEECFEVSKLAVERYPKVPEFSAKLADCLAKKEDYRGAVEEMQRAIDKAKTYGEQFESSNFDEDKIKLAEQFIEAWQKKIILTPEEKRRKLSKLTKELDNYKKLHDYEKVFQIAVKIFALKPDKPEVVENIAQLCITLKKPNAAVKVTNYLEKFFPPTAYRLRLRARSLALKRNYLEAIKAAEQALTLADGDLSETMILYSCLGQFYSDIGNAEKAIEYLRRSAKCKLPAQKKSIELTHLERLRCADYSNMLFMMYNLNFSQEEIFEETRGFNELLVNIPRYSHDRKKHSRHKKIRVGYISPDISRHVVAFFSLQLFKSYDKTRFEVFIYADNEEDFYTEQLKANVDHFTKILGEPFLKIAEMILKDEIDILVDLAGHTGRNSLPVLAYKPAPIQLSGIGYLGSTGLDTIDYFLADKFTDPEGLNEKYFTEKILRLQHSHFCFVWHELPRPIAPAPCTKNGYVTFVSFNNFKKVTNEMLGLWKKILDTVPNSRLYLKSPVFSEYGLKLSKEKIQAAGIDLERVDFEDVSKDYIIKYERADIALDTFPYPGGGTTCDALHMGVPVITLVGERHNSRFGYSLLTNMGLQELCAFSEDEYVQKAIDLANDWERIREYHQTIQRRMEDSPVMNDTIYMGDLEAAYEKIFNAWIKGEPLPDFPQEPEPVTEELADKYIQRAEEYLHLENKIGESDCPSRFDFKRTLYYSELAAQCESKRDAKLLLTIADRRYKLDDNLGAYEAMREAVDYIYSAAGVAKHYSKFFISECHRKLAGFAQDNGRHVEAIEHFQKAFELAEDEKTQLDLYDALLLTFHYLDVAAEDMAAYHFDYQNFFADVKPFTTYHKPYERIKIGYIGGDFRQHAAFAVTFGFISCHDRTKFEITCYSKNQKDDDYTEIFRQAVEHFVDVKDLSAVELAKRIHDDEIDIAFDLAGHTGYNGLPALAYRPAPVQISGIGYMSTTGLKAIDYFLTDEILDPPGEHDKYFVEKLLYMPAQFSYARRENVPTPEGAACVKNGYVTFGTICRYSKISDDMLAIWIEILNRVPTAKLLMRAQEFISNRTQNELYDKMKGLGCDMDRVIFFPALPDYFEAISEIDILLDAYPWVGGTTTLDALYMGVPVISFYSDRHSTRFGKSILHSVGLNELAVNDVAAYINTAVGLANDFDTLDALHKNLRDMFETSDALDPVKYCRLLEKKFAEILGR
ncbi:MAG: glycosyltransferase [Quinella sp. 1Q5]|nr:glycosyltransferase [Quinella sp. 1Q5]